MSLVVVGDPCFALFRGLTPTVLEAYFSVMRRRQPTAVLGAVMAIVLMACTGGSGVRRTVPTSTARSSSPVVRAVAGQPLGLHSMAYLASNRVSALFGMMALGPANVIVGQRTAVRVQLGPPLALPVWVSIPSQRLVVHEHDGAGEIQVATDGCPMTARTPACDTRRLFAPSAWPIGPAPTPGVVVEKGFVLHLATAAIAPGRYDFDIEVRYPRHQNAPTVLDVTDTLHVRLDVDTRPQPSGVCTLDDLHRPAPAMPTPHAISDTFVLERGGQRLDPPLPDAKPRTDAAEAWQTLSTSRVPTGGGQAALVLASLSSTFPRRPQPDGPTRPRNHAVLAWVLYSHDVAVDPASISHGPQPPSITATTTPQPPCIFLDGLAAVDASSGQMLFSSGGTREPSPIHL